MFFFLVIILLDSSIDVLIDSWVDQVVHLNVMLLSHEALLQLTSDPTDTQAASLQETIWTS